MGDYAEKLDWQLKQVGSSLAEMKKIGVKNFPRQRPLYQGQGQKVRFWTPSRKSSCTPSSSQTRDLTRCRCTRLRNRCRAVSTD